MSFRRATRLVAIPNGWDLAASRWSLGYYADIPRGGGLGLVRKQLAPRAGGLCRKTAARDRVDGGELTGITGMARDGCGAPRSMCEGALATETRDLIDVDYRAASPPRAIRTRCASTFTRNAWVGDLPLAANPLRAKGSGA